MHRTHQEQVNCMGRATNLRMRIACSRAMLHLAHYTSAFPPHVHHEHGLIASRIRCMAHQFSFGCNFTFVYVVSNARMHPSYPRSVLSQSLNNKQMMPSEHIIIIYVGGILDKFYMFHNNNNYSILYNIKDIYE